MSEPSTRESGDADARTLRTILLQPTADDLVRLASLISSAVDTRRNELILTLGHQLAEHGVAAILDTEDHSIPAEGASRPATTEPTPLTADERVKVVDSLRLAGLDADCDVTLLYDPSATPIDAADIHASLAGDASSNDAEVVARWRPRGLVILIRRAKVTMEEMAEIRLGVLGNVDSGKSTILGVMTKGRLDDGRGRARVSLFRHKHEIETGRTSSIGLEIMGFSSRGDVVQVDSHAQATALTPKDANAHQGQAARRQALSWTQICSASCKVLSFIDLAGHERYLRTTLAGLTGQEPHLVTLIVGGNAGMIGMSKEHLSVALALQVPIMVVVTKVDMTPPQVLQQTLRQIAKIVRSPGCRKQPVFVKDAGYAAELAVSYAKEKICPIFLVSNVSGFGLDLLKTYLNCIPASVDNGAADKPFEFSISEVFSVPFVGTVVSGLIQAGRCKTGDTFILGPDSTGQWTTTSIKSIHRKRVPVDSGEAGQSVSFSLKRIRRNAVRKGMVLLAKPEGANPPVVRRFEANVLVLHHASTVSVRYSAMCHIGAVRQTVRIVEIADQKVLRTGDRARVTLEFTQVPEHIRLGERLIFREGRSKGMGVVTKLLPPT